MGGSSKLRKYRADHEDLNTNSRSAIIDAGQVLFLKQGIASTTMGEIAEQAGVSRVTVYRHFPECGAIAFEVNSVMLESILDATRAGLSAGAGRLEAARQGLESLFSAYSTHESAFRFCAVFGSFYAVEARSDELAEWYDARDYLGLGEACTSLFDSQLDQETSDRLRMLTDIAASGLCSLAISSASTNSDAEARLGNLKELILGHFDAVLAPNA